MSSFKRKVGGVSHEFKGTSKVISKTRKKVKHQSFGKRTKPLRKKLPKGAKIHRVKRR
jgi:hypothetical protein